MNRIIFGIMLTLLSLSMLTLLFDIQPVETALVTRMVQDNYSSKRAHYGQLGSLNCTTGWNQTYGGDGNDFLYSMVQTSMTEGMQRQDHARALVILVIFG